MKTHYNTIKETVSVIESIKNSKFITFVFQVKDEEEIKYELDRLKEIHSKASHFCYAYRLGLDENNFRANDDGEPSGSAGLPILNQIDSFELTMVLVVVIRYYGGTKLGVSGLISAYKNGAKEVLSKAEIVKQEVEQIFIVTCSYLEVNDLLNFLKQLGISEWKQEYTDECKISFNIGVSRTESLILWLDNKGLIYKSETCY